MTKGTKHMTTKQHGFACDVLAGMTLVDAYKNNYAWENMKYETIKRKGVETRDHPLVLAFIEKGRAEIEEEVKSGIVIDIQTQTEKLERIASMYTTDPGPAVRAIEAQSKLHGLLIEKREDITGKGVLNIMHCPDIETAEDEAPLPNV